MSIVTKQIEGGTARVTSRGVEVVQVFRAKETGTTFINSAAEPLALIRAVNENLASGPPIPMEGEVRSFTNQNGNVIQIICRQVQVRKVSCNYVRFQCWFSTFTYWSGPGNPTSPDPRVVSISPSGLLLDPPVLAPRFVRKTIESDGGSGSTQVWVQEEPYRLRVRQESLTVRCFLPNGITDAQYGAINNFIGYLHTFSGTNWEFLGAAARESAGGFVSGDPVTLFYSWQTERPNGQLFANESNVLTLPARAAFERYYLSGFNPNGEPIVVAEIPEGLDYLNPSAPTSWQGFPGNPILS